MASCLGKGLYGAKALVSPGLLDFFVSAPARERPWQLKLDNGMVGAAGGLSLALFAAGAPRDGLGSGLRPPKGGFSIQIMTMTIPI